MNTDTTTDPKTLHTPGPWVYCAQPGVGYIRPLAPGEIISKMESQTGVGFDEVRANARLIAAAPDLLAACETLLHIIHQQVACVDTKFDNGITSARAAIAKAIAP